MKIFEREENNRLKIISLGGWGEVTQNLFVYEYQNKIKSLAHLYSPSVWYVLR